MAWTPGHTRTPGHQDTRTKEEAFERKREELASKQRASAEALPCAARSPLKAPKRTSRCTHEALSRSPGLLRSPLQVSHPSAAQCCLGSLQGLPFGEHKTKSKKLVLAGVQLGPLHSLAPGESPSNACFTLVSNLQFNHHLSFDTVSYA